MVLKHRRGRAFNELKKILEIKISGTDYQNISSFPFFHF